MRPVRLEIEGFASFKERTVIDFDGVELFALTGPTGAGKSSILDAIVFSLYGSVPRYDRKAVMPVITQGKLEAKVRLDFSVGDEQFSVARRVRRAGNPACSFEKEGQAIAAGIRDVQPEIERVIGLTFDQFTKCVLLPQGAFARFLHDSGAERNELLRKLMSLEIYSQLRHRAVNRADCLRSALQLKQGELQGIGDFSSEGLKAAEERSAVLIDLFDRVELSWEKIEDLERERLRARSEATAADKDLELLGKVAIPPEVTAISETIARAQTNLAVATKDVARASETVTENQEIRDKLPSIDGLKTQIGSHEKLTTSEADLKKLEGEVSAATEARDNALAKEKAASERLEACRTKFELIKSAHQGFTVAKRLKVGDPCPVCGGSFERCPTEEPEDYKTAQEEAKAAEEEHGKLFKAVVEAEAQVKTRSSLLTQKQEEVRAQLEEISSLPGVAELKAALADAERAQEACAVAQRALAQALKDEGTRRAELETARSAATVVASRLTETKQNLVHLNPPSDLPDDPAKGWQNLHDWAKTTTERVEIKAKAAQTLATELELRREALEKGLCEEAAKVGVLPDDRNIRDCCMEALSNAKQHLTNYGASLERAKAIRNEIKELEADERVYRKLSEHLKTNRFETWLLNRSFRELCDLASVKLRELSMGQYSIGVTDSNDFQIIDHANADERRSVKSLSGGETFLASLSLALALAEGVASRSATGARLESLFLDEGFGSLDSETLETVAGAVEELGSKGRMIGVVTHVRDFAERLPVRFEVRKGTGGSKVERVQV